MFLPARVRLSMRLVRLRRRLMAADPTYTRHDMEISAGDDIDIEVTIQTKAGVAIDITGWTFLTQMRRAGVLVATGAAAIVTAAAGTVSIAFDSADTTGLSGAYDWELQVTTDTSRVSSPMRGVVRVRTDVAFV